MTKFRGAKENVRGRYQGPTRANEETFGHGAPGPDSKPGPPGYQTAVVTTRQ
jgi:hypothetical protein